MSTEKKKYERLLTFATLASVATAFVLIFAKLAAWLLTGSLSVLASLVDSMLDAMSSIVNLLAVRYALQPADDDHRFGHGKAESLGALVQTAFICGSAIFLILHAIDDLRSGAGANNEQIGIWVILFSIVMTLILLAIQSYVVKRTGSVAIKADSMHYRMDLVTNASIILALVLSSMGYKQLDAIFAIGIALYMLYSVREIAMESFDLLMDRELPEEDLAKIVESAMAVKGVDGVHDLRTRLSGMTPIVQLHIEMDGRMSLNEAHVIAVEVMKKIAEVIPRADVIVHEDPSDDSREDLQLRQ